LLSAVLLGGWYFFQHGHLPSLDKLKSLAQSAPADPNGGTVNSPDVAPPPANRATRTVRIASFNIQGVCAAQLQKPQAMKVLADVVRRFDVVAIQEVRAKTDDILPRFVELINSTGRRYDYVIGPRLGRTVSTEQYAFIFDTASIETDRQALYTVADPDDR